MLYERKNIKKFIKSKFFHNSLLIAGLLAISGEILYLFAPASFWTPIAFIDLVNVIAQLATAGALYLGIHQYLRTKNSERQAAFVKECRDLIDHMNATSVAFTASDHSYRSSLAFMEQMNTHAGNFNTIFKELNEDVHKAIVRMHWQNMYFGKLTLAMDSWEPSSIVSGLGVDDVKLVETLAEYAVYSVTSPPIKVFSNFHKAQFLVENSFPENHKGLKDEDRFVFFFFQRNLFEDDALTDQLYGTFNVIEARARAPVVAAINAKFNKKLTEIIKKQIESDNTKKQSTKKWNFFREFRD